MIGTHISIFIKLPKCALKFDSFSTNRKKSQTNFCIGRVVRKISLKDMGFSDSNKHLWI